MKTLALKLLRLKAIYKILLIFTALLLFFASYFAWIFLSLPPLFKVSDYHPPLLTQVYDRDGNKIGEFFKERRLLAPYEDIPAFVIQAFISAEDGSFFSHKGINYKAIARAFLANLKAGKKVQGGSTITQQLARTLLLSTKKTYTRKLKEALLALRIERSLSKRDILYIYLNQIYFGHGAYGLELAAQTYFRKPAKELNLAEGALLAGLPKAPSRFSPVFYPARAKSRQLYVLSRMRREGYLSEEEMNKLAGQNIKVFLRRDFSGQSPYYLETVRRILLTRIESEDLLRSGLKIWTAMDGKKQKSAQKALRKALEDWDKRRGFRGVEKNLADPKGQADFAKKRDQELRDKIKSHLLMPGFVLPLSGEDEELPPEFFSGFKEKFKALEEELFSRKFWLKSRKKLEGKIFPALISQAGRDKIEALAPWGPEALALEDFDWAVPLEKKPDQDRLKSAKEIFKANDIAFFRVKALAEGETAPKDSIPLELYQEPPAEGAFLSFDLQNEEILALVGGYGYSRSQYNRAYQSRRQSGSAFKPFVYGAALERGFHPTSLISDSPVVFSPKEAEEKSGEEEKEEALALKDMWRPSNISDRFLGDILFRKALIRSLNVPTVRIIEKIGLDWVRFYVRRLGIFSPLNSDFTMALGSSSLSLYETLKAFSVFARQGRQLKPILIRRAESAAGEEILSGLSLDEFFKEDIARAREWAQKEKSRWFKEGLLEEEMSDFQKRWRGLFEEGSRQLIPPSNSYVLMNLLEAVIKDSEGTARRARSLGRPAGGKTGTTDGYYDTWFVGATPFISAGIWLGFDSEKSLGKGETASRAALPGWIQYMEESHKDLPVEEFPIPEKVVFANIDAEKGGLVSAKSKEVAHQAFIEGSEPQFIKIEAPSKESPFAPDETDFIREDLSR